MITVRTGDTSNFQKAARAGKLIRQAFAPYLNTCVNPDITSRLMTVLMEILKTAKALTGKACFEKGKISLLQRFKFNPKGDIYNVFGEAFFVTIDRYAGEVILKVPPFNPFYSFFKQNYGSHFKVICAVAELDFENNAFDTFDLSGGLISRTLNDDFTTIHVGRKIRPLSKLPMIAIIGIQFFIEHGKQMHPLVGPVMTPLEIVWVDVSRG